MGEKKKKIGLVANNIDILIQNFMTSSKVEFYHLNFSWKNKSFPNPYSLLSIDNADYIIIDTGISPFIINSGLENDTEKIFSSIRAKSKNGLIGAEGADWFHLAQKPAIYNELDIILKSGGIYRDREQYNSYSGSCSSNHLWNRTDIPNPLQYNNLTLDKINVSLPCFIAVDPFFRRRLRKTSPNITTLDRIIRNTQEQLFHFYMKQKSKNSSSNSKYHFRGSITHLSRFLLGERINEIDIAGTYKLLFTSDEYMWGSKYGRKKIPLAYNQELKEKAKSLNFFGERISKKDLIDEMLSHGIVLSPNGFGELCYRHAEAWQLNRVLLCQDLSHVEMLFNIEHEKNAIFCKSDFSDIKERLLDLENDSYRNNIALNGKKEWENWISNPSKILHEGFEKYLLKEG